MRRIFVEASGFTTKLKKIGADELLSQIQKEILEDPEVGFVIEGTGGIRKFRVARSGGGKSGGFRVFYFDLPEMEITHLLVLISKNERENISQAEKNQLKILTKKLKERRSA